MPPEVLEAIVEAIEYFVDMNELTEAAGGRVAEVMGAEAAIVTSGGFASLLLGSAACLTGTDMDRMRALPNVTWARRNCLIQTPHRFSYDHAYRAAGMTNVYVDSRRNLSAESMHRSRCFRHCPRLSEEAQLLHRGLWSVHLLHLIR